jgi:signal transduction histidine kinase
VAPAARAQACQPQVDGVSAVRANGLDTDGTGRPTVGWTPVSLPDLWSQRWPAHDGTAWYRIDWHWPCTPPKEPLAIAIDYINMAGAVYVNDDLLWTDRSLAEPLSRSWNTPRYLVAPPSVLRPGANTVFVKVVGSPIDGAGLGRVRIGTADTVEPLYSHQVLLRRTLPALNLVISMTLGCFFLALWLMRRSERSYGWYALTSFTWLLFASNTVVSTPWPFATTDSWSRWVTVALLAYTSSFCIFLCRFGGLRFVRAERALWLAAGLGAATVAFISRDGLGAAQGVAFLACAALFMGACAAFVGRAASTRQPEHLLLAVCVLGFLVAAVHDVLMVLRVLPDGLAYTTVSAPLIMVGMSAILAWSVTRNLRRIERFNLELEERITITRHELTQTLGREHALALANARLGERLQLAHDLHDGLGGSLVRSIALVEQSAHALEAHQYLSMFKSLRDDLRQVIDSSSSATARIAATPAEWIAPIRHRFNRIFEELNVASRWQLPARWPCELSPKQLLGLTRFLEEALTNVIKHSRASEFEVRLLALDHERCAQGGHGEHGGQLSLSIEDNGVGFDVQGVAGSILGIGLRSMHARIARIGGTLEIASAPGCTRLEARVRVTPPEGPERPEAPGSSLPEPALAPAPALAAPAGAGTAGSRRAANAP